MAQLSDDMQRIMVQIRAERQAMFPAVSELSRRLQPRHLLHVTTHYAKQKVAGVIGGVSDAVKENGGTAAAVALGAVAVFDVGRRSADNGYAGTGEANHQKLTGGTHSDAAPIRYQPVRREAVTNLDRGKVLAASAGGLLLGHVIGQAFESTEKERALFGKVAAEVHDAADKFVSEHSRGAKLAAAQAFGFARYGATFLAILAVASDYFIRADKDSESQMRR